MNVNLFRQLGAAWRWRSAPAAIGPRRLRPVPAVRRPPPSLRSPCLHRIRSSPTIPPPRPAPVYSRDVAPILDRYCLSCHDRIAAEGGVILDAFGDEVPGTKSRPLLLKMAAVLRSESMPPEDEPRPSPDERETLEAWLDAALGAEGSGARPGDDPPPQSHRVQQHDPRPDRPRPAPGRRLPGRRHRLRVRQHRRRARHAADPRRDGAGRRRVGDRCGLPIVRGPRADHEPARRHASLAFRKYTPPVRTPREDKILPGRRDDRGPRAGPTAAHLRHPAQPSPTGPSAAPRPTTS